MKKILLLIALIGTQLCSAQNYQCLQDNVLHYFVNKRNYLRAGYNNELSYSGSSVFFHFVL